LELLPFIRSYFPEEVVTAHGDDLENHMLFHEIAATVQVNHIVGRAGIEFLPVMVDALEREASEVTAAYLVMEKLLRADEIRAEIEALEGTVPTDVLYPALIAVEDHLRRGVFALLTLRTDEASLAWISELAGSAETLAYFVENDRTCLPKEWRTGLIDRSREWVQGGIPRALAKRIALLEPAAYIPAIWWFAQEAGYDAQQTIRHFYYAGEVTGITPLRNKLAGQVYREEWDQLAIHSIDKALLGSLVDIIRLSVPQSADPNKASILKASSPLRKTARQIDDFSLQRIPVSACFVLNERIRETIASLSKKS
jgi:glutamate dehydrogenase